MAGELPLLPWKTYDPDAFAVLSGVNAQMWTSEAYSPGAIPPTQLLELGALASPSDTSLTLVSPTTQIIYGGTMLSFPSENVLVTTQAPIGATTLTVKALTIGLAAAEQATTPVAYIPVYSGNTFDLTGTPNEIADNFFGGGPADYKLITSTSFTSTFSGPETPGDPGLVVWRLAEANSLNVRFVFYPAENLRGHGGEATVSITSNYGKNVISNISATLAINGATTEENYNADAAP